MAGAPLTQGPRPKSPHSGYNLFYVESTWFCGTVGGERALDLGKPLFILTTKEYKKEVNAQSFVHI